MEGLRQQEGPEKEQDSNKGNFRVEKTLAERPLEPNAGDWPGGKGPPHPSISIIMVTLLSTSFMPGTVPGNGHPGSHLSTSKPPPTLQGVHHCPHFADKQTEAQ